MMHLPRTLTLIYMLSFFSAAIFFFFFFKMFILGELELILAEFAGLWIMEKPKTS